MLLSGSLLGTLSHPLVIQGGSRLCRTALSSEPHTDPLPSLSQTAVLTANCYTPYPVELRVRDSPASKYRRDVIHRIPPKRLKIAEVV